MLEQGKWKDGAPVPSKEFHDRFEESLKLIEKKAGEKAPAGAEIIRMNRKTKPPQPLWQSLSEPAIRIRYGLPICR